MATRTGTTQGAPGAQPSALIRDTCPLPADVLSAFRTRCSHKGINFTRFTWKDCKHPPPLTNDRERVVALMITMGTLEHTFNFLWEWMAEGQRRSMLWEELRSDADHLRDFRDPLGANFQPFTLQWVVIQLDANRDRDPEWVRQHVDPSQIAGLEVMAAIAQHPQIMAARSGFGRNLFNLAAIQVHWEQDGLPWLRTPHINFFLQLGEISLLASPTDSSDPQGFCPMLLPR